MCSEVGQRRPGDAGGDEIEAFDELDRHAHRQRQKQEATDLLALDDALEIDDIGHASLTAVRSLLYQRTRCRKAIGREARSRRRGEGAAVLVSVPMRRRRGRTIWRT